MGGQRKKILYVVTQGNWGGAQKYVFDLATAAAQDYEVVVASGTEDQQLAHALQEQGMLHIPLPHLRRAINPWHDALALRDLYRLIQKLQPDIVHLNSSKAGALGSLAAKLAGSAKVIFTMHGLVLTEPLPPLIKMIYFVAEKLSAYCKDILIAVSAADKEAALHYRLKSADKITGIHNGIDLTQLRFKTSAEAKQTLGQLVGIRLETKKIIGTIADFYPTKGLPYLIQAAVAVCAANPDALFILIGRGDPDPLLSQVKRACLASQFFILNSLLQPDSYLKAFNLFVLPSVKEGLPYTILEAAAAEIPIVATTVGGIPEILRSGESALLVPPANPQALAAGINDVLQHPQKARGLAEHARRSLPEFSLERMISETEKVYKSLL